MRYRNNSDSLADVIAESVFNDPDFNSSVESVIDDYDMDDKIDNALKDHDFGISDLEEKVDNNTNLAEDAISRVNDLERYVDVQVRIIKEFIDSNEKCDKIIESLLSRIEQLEALTTEVDWDELLKL